MSLRKSLIGTVTILSLWGLSPGEEAHHKKAEEAGSSKPGHGMMEGCGMHGMMKMHDMMGGAMVATSDGGVVLRVGMT